MSLLFTTLNSPDFNLDVIQNLQCLQDGGIFFHLHTTGNTVQLDSHLLEETVTPADCFKAPK